MCSGCKRITSPHWVIASAIRPCLAKAAARLQRTVWVLGADFQRLLVMGNGLRNAALVVEGSAEVVVGQQVVGLDLQRSRIGRWLRESSLLREDSAEVVVGHDVVGVGVQRLPEMGHRLVKRPCVERQTPRLLWAST